MQRNDPRVAASLSASVLTASGGDLVLAEWRHPGGGTDPPTAIALLHVPRSDDEAWYVLEGALSCRLVEEAGSAGLVWA
jgi:hypothetical protein